MFPTTVTPVHPLSGTSQWDFHTAIPSHFTADAHFSAVPHSPAWPPQLRNSSQLPYLSTTFLLLPIWGFFYRLHRFSLLTFLTLLWFNSTHFKAQNLPNEHKQSQELKSEALFWKEHWYEKLPEYLDPQATFPSDISYSRCQKTCSVFYGEPVLLYRKTSTVKQF